MSIEIGGPQPRATPLRGDVAIVGMGCLFAGAPDLDTYWQNILSKFDAISDPPADEWDPKLFYDPKSKSNDRVYCKRGGYVGDLSHFRPLDFGVMPVTVDGGEPDQWLALRVAHEALADAGYSESPKEHVRTEVILGKGTYVNRGNLTVGYHGMIIEYFLQALKNLNPEYTEAEILEIKNELKTQLPPFSADTAPALIGNIIAGRIANRLDLMGPSFTVDAACASALLAIEIGFHDLLSHKCDLVLAGGANVNAPLPTIGLFCQLGALSRREQIRPFDKRADGTLLGEGLGVIVLKRREDAERDGNRIYAIVKGVGVASDGRALHVMAPRVEGEELALRRAYEMAGLSPETVGLIEAHGTATPVGDVTEIQALGRVFGQRKGALPSCALGSVKSMIGHTMPAAGIAGVIKTALSLHHRVLPPTLNCEEPNPALGLDKTPFYINTETRPWIHGAGTPRRAGVSSFGFGGINAHVVLEEYPSEAVEASSHQLHWDTEVCILEADSREGLLERGARLRKYLGQSGDLPLKDVAYTLNTRLNGLASRLAIVAATKTDLDQKLALALGRLADKECRQIKDHAGIYYFDPPLRGKLAFLFPGEGAQYPNMLLDLCLHFPEVRSCFDLLDRALSVSSRRILPSELIFPRSILGEAERSEVRKALWQIDGAVEGVLVGNWAMWTLLGCLEIRPEMLVGHSTGDYSAMLASNVFEVTDKGYVETIVEWNKAFSRVAERNAISEATLIAVAADSATARSIVEAIGGDLHLAMDNCPHQTILAASKEDAGRVTECLRDRGIIYEILPFDRPYHTPLFQKYAEGAGDEVFAKTPILPPKTATYSCTTAGQYPEDIEEIRKLFVSHWVRPVLFTETVKKMYEDGARLFVEVGPSGNLTAFVSDILRGKPHLAMPANLSRRSGLTQINHLVGALASEGVEMRLDYLYARRHPSVVPWENTGPIATKRRPAPIKLSLALPPLKVSPRPKPLAFLDRATNSSFPKGNEGNNPQRLIDTPVPAGPTRDSNRPEIAAPRHGGAVAVATRPDLLTAHGRTDTRALAMQDYFKGMETFLQVEEQVMRAFFNRVQTAECGKPLAPFRPPQNRPFLRSVTSIGPMELTAVHRLSQEDDLFLSDHALGGPISLTDPGLRPLVVLPLTMCMEILAEAAAALMPGQVLVGMRDVQAHHWITVDAVPTSLQIFARRMTQPSREVWVQIRNMTDANGKSNVAPAVEGIMIFADDYPTPPKASSVPLEAERISHLASAQLYDGRMMFHGPCFQGVASVDRSGQNGVIGQLRTLPSGNLFRSVQNPGFVTDPVVLDAAGQLVGFWAAEYLRRGFVVFPYQLERLHIYGPNRQPGSRLTCQVRVQLKGSEHTRSSIEIAGDDGTVWMQLQGWADRRFDPPRKLYEAWVAPHEAILSEIWQTPLAGMPEQGALECYRLESLLEQGDELWKELWASLVLSEKERKVFKQHRGTAHRPIEWLSGRTVAKDAIRSFLRKHYGLKLLPADIEITQDDYGKPVANGLWRRQVAAVPDLSLSHSQGMAVALVGDPSNGRRFGVDVQAIRQPNADLEAFVLDADERRLLHAVPEPIREEWVFRLWCVKEAVSKALGRGLVEGPRSVKISTLNLQTGVVGAAPQGKLAEAVPDVIGQKLLAYTAKDGSYVVASAVCERRLR